MQSRGPLMVEHRLIEKMIDKMHEAAMQIRAEQGIDPFFIDAVVDFIHFYADRTHHGKEEAIFFKRLESKELSEEDRRIMNELLGDHEFARAVTRKLSEANRKFKLGDDSALVEIAGHLFTLSEFYPQHIKKEDTVFFPASRNYLTLEEDSDLIALYSDFDRQLIHEKYKAVVAELKL